MTIIATMIALCVGVLLYMFKQANENNVRLHTIRTAGKDETIRLFFISDTHARKINEQMIASITEPVDCVVIGGDFVDRRTSKHVMHENIRLLKTLGPVYFVWGNNDREQGENELRQLFKKHEIVIIENESIIIESKNNVKISAVDFQFASRGVERAIQNCDEQMTIFIAHNPQVFPKIHSEFKPLLSIGAHLHGGQIRLGNFGIQPHGYFAEKKGHYELVSNGYGTTLVPLRLGAKPECHLIEIKFNPNTIKL
ncbi:metallophosphoesterase [Solibacillus cecembensis]|uniref:metallophosphoesterase n=1 Tax=Solibacillus cecembensis TaxID=459347 RepID=UPI003CFBCE95